MNNSVTIKIENIKKSFDNIVVLNGISFNVRKGEFLSIVGPSGCGKTTLLRIIAGLEYPDTGKVNIFSYEKKNLNLQVAIVFQEFNLLPWRRVLDNVKLGIEYKGIKKNNQILNDILKALSDVGLKKYERAYPHELSVGEKQRVGLARAIVSNPDVLLLDEPFGAVDAITKIQLENQLNALIKDYKKTSLLVTHDIEEAIITSERILVMSQKPSKIIGEFHIDLPTKFNDDIRYSQKFLSYKKEIWNCLKSGIQNEK